MFLISGFIFFFHSYTRVWLSHKDDDHHHDHDHHDDELSILIRRWRTCWCRMWWWFSDRCVCVSVYMFLAILLFWNSLLGINNILAHHITSLLGETEEGVNSNVCVCVWLLFSLWVFIYSAASQSHATVNLASESFAVFFFLAYWFIDTWLNFN